MEKSYSNKVCPVERSGALEMPIRKLVHNPVKILKPYISTGDKVLDFGCGPGFFTFAMAQLAGESGLVYAADLQDGMLDIVRKKIARYNMQNRIKLHKCEAGAINLNETFDFILAFYVVHEIGNQNSAFQELKRILKPGGKILIIEPDFHVTKSSFREMIIKLENAGFSIKPSKKLIFSRSILGINS